MVAAILLATAFTMRATAEYSHEQLSGTVNQILLEGGDLFRPLEDAAVLSPPLGLAASATRAQDLAEWSANVPGLKTFFMRMTPYFFYGTGSLGAEYEVFLYSTATKCGKRIAATIFHDFAPYKDAHPPKIAGASALADVTRAEIYAALACEPQPAAEGTSAAAAEKNKALAQKFIEAHQRVLDATDPKPLKALLDDKCAFHDYKDGQPLSLGRDGVVGIFQSFARFVEHATDKIFPAVGHGDDFAFRFSSASVTSAHCLVSSYNLVRMTASPEDEGRRIRMWKMYRSADAGTLLENLTRDCRSGGTKDDL